MLNYPQLFYGLGKVVYASNLLLEDQYTIYLAPYSGIADGILNAYAYNKSIVANWQQQVNSFASTMAGQIGSLTQLTNATLASLQQDLNAPNSTPTSVLPLLYRQMVIDGQSVQKNVIAAPIITPAAGNNGNGVLVASTINALGITDERSQTQDVSFLCTSSQWSGGTAGSERFSVTGWPTLQSPNNYGPVGAGVGPGLTVGGNGGNILPNGNFDSWNTASPPQPLNWVVSPGAPANVVQSNVIHSGTNPPSYACALTGDGTTTTITLSQNIATLISSGSLTVYAMGIWLRKSGTVTAGSTLTVSITGSGVTTETLLAIDPSTLTTTYQLTTLFFATQRTVPPANYSFNISWTNANTAGGSAVILVDDVNFFVPLNFGFVNYALFRGSTDFAVGDQITSATTLVSAGVFQEYFVRWQGFQLPSSNSPTIPDAWAETEGS